MSRDHEARSTTLCVCKTNKWWIHWHQEEKKISVQMHDPVYHQKCLEVSWRVQPEDKRQTHWNKQSQAGYFAVMPFPSFHHQIWIIRQQTKRLLWAKRLLMHFVERASVRCFPSLHSWSLLSVFQIFDPWFNRGAKRLNKSRWNRNINAHQTFTSEVTERLTLFGRRAFGSWGGGCKSNALITESSRLWTASLCRDGIGAGCVAVGWSSVRATIEPDLAA